MSDDKLNAAVHAFLLQQGLVKTARQLEKDCPGCASKPAPVDHDELQRMLDAWKERPAKKQKRAASSTPGSAGSGSGDRFRRVDAAATDTSGVSGSDNSWDALRAKGHTYADKAQERLGAVKGKNFRKEMTKAKRGTYRGGNIDMAVNSIKFQYDD
jgi:hypothetical protein